MSNLSKWNRWYAGMEETAPYGDTVSYQMGGDFLSPCEVIEDWGCGKGWFTNFLGPDQTYIGLDGSKTPFADKIVDLETYRSEVPGIFMRHVLEHNYEWEKVLANAVSSFTYRMALVLFTPMSKGDTKEITFAPDPGVPDLSLSRSRLEMIIQSVATIEKTMTFASATQYEEETVYLLEKPW
jgi:hypothetical protein